MAATETDPATLMRDALAAVDRRDTDAFCAFLADDVRFRFGNAPAVEGIDAVRAAVEGFLASLAAVTHRVERAWPVAGGVVAHGRVTYTRPDGSALTVPFANVWQLAGDRVGEYLIFADVSAL